jgi:hypothetical protein
MRVEKRLDMIGRSRVTPNLVALVAQYTVRPAAKAATRSNIGVGYQRKRCNHQTEMSITKPKEVSRSVNTCELSAVKDRQVLGGVGR